MLAHADEIRSIVDRHRGDRGALLPVLRDVQDTFGYIDQEWVPVLATELNLSRADVHGVLTFYSDFRTERTSATTVRLCRAEACQAVGSERLVADVEQVFGVKLGQTTPDGTVRLDQVFCLGNCALGPAVQIDGRTYGRMDRERIVRTLVSDPGAVLSGGERS